MINETKELDELIEQNYIPTSTERKKALLMYFFVGIVISLSVNNHNNYEMFHLKQATGWWCIFFMCLVVSAFLFFIPFFNIIPIIVFASLLLIWVLFAKQAWEWKFVIGIDKILLPFFSWIWSWMLAMFDFESKQE